MDAESNPNYRADPASEWPGLHVSIFEASLLPVAMATGATHVVYYVNPAFCRMMGKSKDELIGNSFAEIMPKDGCLLTLDRVHRTGEAETHTEPEQPEAHSLYWSYTVWPFPGTGERPAGVVFKVTETARFHQQATAMNQELMLAVVRQHELTAQLQQEIAERKRMEQALVNSEKLAVTARFAATMAHEINNPLGAITNLMFLLAPLQTTPEAQAYVAMVDDQLKALGHITTQTLKFHRDSNQPTEFKLSSVLREVSDFYHPHAKKLGVAVNQRIETEGITVGFRGEIVQVISNLLLNAVDATPAGGQISVHLYPAPRWLCAARNQCGYCLSVADTGSGIDPQHRARIFEPFFTTKGERGTGLGLWVCAGIVNRVGGSMRVWSTRRPDRSGTCFSVFLPAEKATFVPLRRKYER
jgi:PAS domain S-box-containing protein